MKSPKVVLLVLVLGLLAPDALGQIKVRERFDGSKNENKPAALLWVLQSDSQGGDFGQADVAVKWEAGNDPFTYGTVVEWHKTTSEDAKSDRLQTKVNADWFSPKRFLSIKPYLVASFGGEFDLLGDADQVKASLWGTLHGDSGIYPGASIRTCSGRLLARWYPYWGVEYFGEPTDGGDAAWFHAGRAYVELWPIGWGTGENTRNLVQVTLTFTRRYGLGDGADSIGTNKILDLGLTVFLDRQGRAGIGVSYRRGEDPSAGFQFVERTTFAFRFKM